MNTYVTYGLGNRFDTTKIHTDLTSFADKPKAAWWGSPVDAKFGWKDWCMKAYWIPGDYGIGEADFDSYFSDNNKILWTLVDDAKVLYINEIKDLDTCLESGLIVKLNEEGYNRYRWDFNKVLATGYTAIELTDAMIGHYFVKDIELIMNGWDCESIVVLDPSKIIILNGGET